jgi:cysteine desulfurase / selenocysteine lyase
MTDYRADFPLLQRQNIAYLDNAATAQRPRCVLDAERTFYEEQNANPLRGLYPLSIAATETVESAREAVCTFLHAASSQEIIFTRNTTEALNLVAYSYGLTHVHAGDEVLVSILAHHSNLLPWQMVCRQTGAKLRFIECEKDGRILPEKAVAMMNEHTKIVAVTHVSNVIGRVNPIRELADAAHRVGAVIVVDGAQSTPHRMVDVQALGADFYAFSGHKVYGPMGIGVLYGRRALLEDMPPFLTGGEMIESVTREGAVYAELPYKFEAGTGNAAGAAGLHAAIDYIGRIGFDAIHQRETALVAQMLDGMKRLPYLHVLGSEKPEEHSGIVTFTVDGVHPHDVSEILAADGVCVRAGHHCARPLLNYLGYSSTVRASCAFYNTPAEIDRLLDSLTSIRGRMGYGQ